MAQTSTTFEAEGGTVTGAVKVSSASASGGQYVDYNAASQTIEIGGINAASAGSRTMTIRYANGRENNWSSGTDVYVNGTLAGTFWDANTGGWTNWANGSMTVSLNAGANTIRLVSKYDHSPNIDYIALPGVTPGGGGGTPPTGTGTVNYEYWSSVGGTAVSAIPVSTAPSGTIPLNSLEAPVDRSDNFGARIRGYLTAPQTGSYTFWVAGDDNAEFWLSTNDQPGTKQRVAYHAGWTNSREWGKYATQKSAAITLTAGSRYYFEALGKEAGGGDNLAVGWAKPGQATTAPSEVVPGTALSPYTGNDGVGGLNVTRIRFFPRSGYASRMTGGRFAGSNETATTGFTTLATISTTPAEGQWTEISVPSGAAAYRFLKYDSPVGGWGNVAEIEFYAGTTKLTGTGSGTAGSNNNSGNTFGRALDGSTSTFFDAASPDDQYVGIDLGAANQAAAPAFSPGSGTYTSAQTVSITTATSGASIRYTTNGSTPSATTGTLYSGPFSVGATTTVRAIAYKTGLADSAVSAATLTIGSTPPPTGANISRVYHIGNSVTDALGYSGLKTMVQSRNGVYGFGRHMIPGAPLEWIWNNPASGFSESPYGLYPNALPNYRWDAVTLQPFDRQLAGDADYSKRYIDLARQFTQNSNTQFYVYSRWPRKNSDGSLPYQQLWLRTYTGGYDGTNETKDYFEKLVLRLRADAPYLSKPVLIVPVGDVFYELDRRMRAGQVPGYTEISQLYSDGIHLTNVGSFAAGSTFYATLYKTDPRGTSSAGYGSIPANVVSAIQQCVWDVVSTHPYSGVQQ